MKILYISQQFYPEMGAASGRVYELSRYWVNRGHDVTVLTSFPNYPDGIIYKDYKSRSRMLFYRETIDGINVVRAFSLPTHLRSSVRRILYYISFFLSSSLAGLFLKRSQVVIATSPSLFIGLTGLLLSRLKGMPLVFEVRDLWPEVIPAIGAGKESSLTYRFFDKVARTLYDKSDLIVVVTESFKDQIVSSRGVSPDKIKIIENAVDTEFFKPQAVDPGTIENLGLRDRFVVTYIGTIGYTHGAEVILKAAPELKRRIPELLFLLVGSGSDKERLVKLSKDSGLDNVRFLDPQPKASIPAFLNASDISLVLSINQPLLHKTIFAKVFEPMACGKPIVVGAVGETRNIVVEKADCGIAFAPEDAAGLIDSILTLYNNPDLRKKFGENGRKYVTANFTREGKATTYINLLGSLIDKPGGGKST
ncbi:MAG TPA: glycosyltransferase family 4 protein [Thermodesulfobacteriota bacterium]|nr:glycosyltransferase family 4 protein [Thermodesulfobacteriota bacterium]